MANGYVTSVLIVVLFSVVVSGGPHFIKKKFEEKCGTDEACLSAAKQCMGERGRGHHHRGGDEPHVDKLTAFNTCLEENGQTASQINEADCVDERPGEEGGRSKRSHGGHGKCKKEIFDRLGSFEESVAGPIRCCFSKALGFDMAKEDGSINLVVFRQHMQDRITDQTILDIYEGAYDACLPRGENCNMYGFRECVFDECLRQVQAQ